MIRNVIIALAVFLIICFSSSFVFADEPISESNTRALIQFGH